MKLISLLSAAGVLGLSLLPHGNAQAGIVAANAVAYCQSSLPVGDVNVRKSPTAVKNIGSANVFVTCSLPVVNGEAVVDSAIYMVNHNADPVDVSCTFVDGITPDGAAFFGDTQFYPGTVTLQPGEFAAIVWKAADYELSNFSGIGNFNCLLPGKVDMTLLGEDTTTP